MATWMIDQPQRLALDGDVRRLDIWMARGRLNVVGTDGPPRLEITSVGRKGVAVTLEDGVLSVRHHISKRSWTWAGPFWWFLYGWHNYAGTISIAVPVTATGSITVISGSVSVSGMRDGATVDVTSGSITLLGLGGVVRAKTVSGSIEALGVGGDLTMETVSGEIALADSSARQVCARTISGAITCDVDNPTSQIRLDTTSGSITVRVPEDADLSVDLQVTSGHVSSVFPQVRLGGHAGMRQATGVLGTGAGHLHANAVSGHVSLLVRPTEDFSDGGPVEGSGESR
jgi:hypothetical protein